MTKSWVVAALLLISACAEGQSGLVDPRDEPDATPSNTSNVVRNDTMDVSSDQADMPGADQADMSGADASNVAACGDRLAHNGVSIGPTGLMIQVPSVGDICELERALDHVCSSHPEIDDLLLTSVEQLRDGIVVTELRVEVLDALLPYLDCFDDIWVGTVSETLLDDPYGAATINDEDSRWRWLRAAKGVAEELKAWMDANSLSGWHWYISYEANLNAFTDVPYRNAYIALLQQHIVDVMGLNVGLVAWSPTFWTPPSSLTTAAMDELEAALQNVFERVPLDLLLLQDHLGVQADWRCEDAVTYFDLLQRAGPSLDAVRMNVEFFQIDGGPIRAGDPTELRARMQCYADAGVELGASFELRYWYDAHPTQ